MTGKANSAVTSNIFVAGFSTTSGLIDSNEKAIGVGATSVSIRTFIEETTVHFVVGSLGSTVNTWNDNNYFAGYAIRIK